MNKAVIGLGSNIEAEFNIEKAKKAIAQQFQVIEESRFVTTKPIGYIQQADFINGSIYIETELNLEELKSNLSKMEKALGRKRSAVKFGPRTIDLDIVVFNGEVVDKDFYEREFLKNSVLELIPELNY